MFYTCGYYSSVTEGLNQFKGKTCILTMLQLSHNHVYLTLLNLKIILNEYKQHCSYE